MNFTTAQIMGWLSLFVFPFFRIGAMFAAMPMFGSRVVPVKIRLGFAVLLTFTLAPLLPTMPDMELISISSLLLVVEQILIGVTMGFVFHLVFTIFVVGGQVVAMQMGLGFASMVDPQNGVQVPVVSQFYVLMVTLLFMAFNGHHLLVEMLLDSFHRLPVGGDVVLQDGWWTIVTWGSAMFANAVKVVLPAIATLLLVNIGFGIVTRSAPQFNIFAVGFPFTMTIGFLAIYMALPNVVYLFEEFLLTAFELLGAL